MCLCLQQLACASLSHRFRALALVGANLTHGWHRTASHPQASPLLGLLVEPEEEELIDSVGGGDDGGGTVGQVRHRFISGLYLRARGGSVGDTKPSACGRSYRRAHLSHPIAESRIADALNWIERWHTLYRFGGRMKGFALWGRQRGGRGVGRKWIGLK